MEDEKLTKFLRFCTGSYMVCLEKKTHRFQQPRRRGKVSSRTYPQSSAESPFHISILSVVRGGMEQHIVLRVLGHWLCLNSHLNLPTRTASLLYISESLAVLNRAEFYAIDCNWCDYTTSELFNVVANLCMEEIEESAINSSSVPPKSLIMHLLLTKAVSEQEKY